MYTPYAVAPLFVVWNRTKTEMMIDVCSSYRSGYPLYGQSWLVLWKWNELQIRDEPWADSQPAIVTNTEFVTMCFIFASIYIYIFVPSLFWWCSLYFQWRSHSLKSSLERICLEGLRDSRDRPWMEGIPPHYPKRNMRMEAPNHGPVRSQHDQHVQRPRVSELLENVGNATANSWGCHSVAPFANVCMCVCVFIGCLWILRLPCWFSGSKTDEQLGT